ncbi:MAG: hypothetical protein FWF24_00310 [Alphaproteobacteria bacterium]|nr:hypothetical protein [Alphaproteobacteria bacterium]
MFDPFLWALACLHVLVLCGLFVFLCRREKADWREIPLILLLLLWASLVLAGHGASLLGALDKIGLYLPLSLLSAFLMGGVFSWLWKKKAKAPLAAWPKIAFEPLAMPRLRRGLFWFLSLTLGLFALISFILCLSVFPDNADSMIYRLPRAFWYVSHGSFLHPFTSLDNRLVYYPLDGVMLYVPMVLYGLPGVFFAIPSFIAWGVVVYLSYLFARSFGADRLFSLFAAWLVGITPNILAQATATNDEIIAAAALLACLFMLMRWLVTGRGAYIFLSVMALGLSAGTKLHIVFLMPFVFLGALLALWQIRKNKAFIKRSGKALGPSVLIACLVILFVMFAPFLFYNFASTGKFYFLDEFKDDVFNLAASLRGGAQNLLIYTAQMTLSPLSDLNVWPDAQVRQSFSTLLNDIFNPLIMPLIDFDPSYYHMDYRFKGITIPVSIRFIEFSLWAGFLWLLWPWQFALALKQKKEIRLWLLLMAMIPALWLLLWSLTTLYMEGTATYFTFYLICAAPVMSLIFARFEKPRWHELRWVFVALVTLTHLVIGHNLVMYSGFRALPDLVHARRLPYDWLLIDENIIKEIKKADNIRILFTHEKMPYFAYMHWNPKARFLAPYLQPPSYLLPPEQDLLTLYPISSLHVYGFMPLKIEGKRTPGLTYLGTARAIGREVLFAQGAGVEQRYPLDADYIVLRAIMGPTPDGNWLVRLAHEFFGLTTQDRLLFAYKIFLGQTPMAQRDAQPEPGFTFYVDAQPFDLRIQIIVTEEWSGREVARATYSFGDEGAWLPATGEY